MLRALGESAVPIESNCPARLEVAHAQTFARTAKKNQAHSRIE